jgi:hypothetical protein
MKKRKREEEKKEKANKIPRSLYDHPVVIERHLFVVLSEKDSWSIEENTYYFEARNDLEKEFIGFLEGLQDLGKHPTYQIIIWNSITNLIYDISPYAIKPKSDIVFNKEESKDFEVIKHIKGYKNEFYDLFKLFKVRGPHDMDQSIFKNPLVLHWICLTVADDDIKPYLI